MHRNWLTIFVSVACSSDPTRPANPLPSNAKLGATAEDEVDPALSVAFDFRLANDVELPSGAVPVAVAIGNTDDETGAEVVFLGSQSKIAYVYKALYGMLWWWDEVDLPNGIPYYTAIADDGDILVGDGSNCVTVVREIGNTYALSTLETPGPSAGIYSKGGVHTFASGSWLTEYNPFRTDVAFPGGWAKNVAVGEMVVDGYPDVAVTGENGVRVFVRFPDGGSTFLSTPSVPWDVAVGDWNGDGRDDIAATLPQLDRVKIWLSTGTASWTAKPDLVASDEPWAIAAGDLDGNGRDDLVVANYQSDDLKVWRSMGNGTFALGATVDVSIGPVTRSGPMDVAIADLTEDGLPDLLVVSALDSFGRLFAQRSITPPTPPCGDGLCDWLDGESAAGCPGDCGCSAPNSCGFFPPDGNLDCICVENPDDCSWQPCCDDADACW